MASLVFNRALELWARGAIDFDTDTFKVLLAGSGYAENKDTHDFRDDVTNEVSGTGYTAGGNTVTVSVTLDTANDRVDISLGRQRRGHRGHPGRAGVRVRAASGGHAMSVHGRIAA